MRWPTYLVALATRAGERGGEALARRLALSGRIGRMVGEARARIEKALAALAQDRMRPSEVVALVERNERAVILVTMAMAGEETRRLLRQALTVWMRVPEPVTGARLRAAGVRPGPGARRGAAADPQRGAGRRGGRRAGRGARPRGRHPSGRGGAVTVLLAIALMMAAPPEPSYLVERIVRWRGETRRVTCSGTESVSWSAGMPAATRTSGTSRWAGCCSARWSRWSARSTRT